MHAVLLLQKTNVSDPDNHTFLQHHKYPTGEKGIHAKHNPPISCKQCGRCLQVVLCYLHACMLPLLPSVFHCHHHLAGCSALTAHTAVLPNALLCLQWRVSR